MNDQQRAAMQMALEALEDISKMQDYYGNGFDLGGEITALREALAQREQQEPVAWRTQVAVGGEKYMWNYTEAKVTFKDGGDACKYQALYTTQPTAALAARQMRDAAVKVCDELYKHDRKSSGYDEGFNDGLDLAEQAIAALPVPEVQWRDLTDDDIADVFWDDFSKQREEDYTWNDVARAVIAKFKEVNK